MLLTYSSDLRLLCLLATGPCNTIYIDAHHNEGNGYYYGHILVYDHIGNTWANIGQYIDGESDYYTLSYSDFISSDLKTVAVGDYYNGKNGRD